MLCAYHAGVMPPPEAHHWTKSLSHAQHATPRQSTTSGSPTTASETSHLHLPHQRLSWMTTQHRQSLKQSAVTRDLGTWFWNVTTRTMDGHRHRHHHRHHHHLRPAYPSPTRRCCCQGHPTLAAMPPAGAVCVKPERSSHGHTVAAHRARRRVCWRGVCCLW